MNKEYNTRKKMILSVAFSVAILTLTIILSYVLSSDHLMTNLENKSLAPTARHIFGTDWLGRDMLTRTVKGLRFSMGFGFLGAFVGVIIATVLGICSATMGKVVDSIVLWLIDLFIGMPHIVFMILLAFAVGGGARGIVLGVALTHWPTLARVVRNEVYAIKNADYIQVSKSFGKSPWFITRKHIIPAILPQIMVGFLLLFPHAIIHEASITFLGFGLSAQTPSIGIILSEAVKHISIGDWWLAFFPGMLLIIVIKSFDNIGEQMRILTDPSSSNE